jgi:hypothetical protein
MKIPSSLCAFTVAQDLPGNLPDLLSAHAIPPLSSIGIHEVAGFAGWRHALDPVTPETIFCGAMLAAHLVKAGRRIEPAILRAEIAAEEQAEMAAREVLYLKRSEKLEIRKSIIDRMLPEAAPKISAIALMAAASPRLLFSSATSDSAIEALRLRFQAATGVAIHQLSPDLLAASMGFDTRTIDHASFSPSAQDPHCVLRLGSEFLTWLWHVSESRNSLFTIDRREYSVCVDGPLHFHCDASGGALDAAVKSGCPTMSSEARASLQDGKLLLSATIMIASGGDSWSCRLDAQSFAMRSIKCPRIEELLDFHSLHQQRIIDLTSLHACLVSLYRHFLALRCSAGWNAALCDIRAWVAARA